MRVVQIVVGIGFVAGFMAEPALSQATFVFANYGTSAQLDAPVFDASGIRLAGTNYVAVLYGGAAPSSLEPARILSDVEMPPVPFTYMAEGQSGYFIMSHFVRVYGVGEGASAWLQVRAWDARLGATYDDVAQLGIGGYGESPLFYTYGGDLDPPGPSPQPLRGLQSFSLHPIPEPDVWGLLAIGAGFLFWRCRSSRRTSTPR